MFSQLLGTIVVLRFLSRIPKQNMQRQRPDRGYSEAIMARVLSQTQRCETDKSLTPRILCLSVASDCVRSEACCCIDSFREVIRIIKLMKQRN